MPDICSAEPDRLFRFVAAADTLYSRLIPEATALGVALDEAQRSCGDYCRPLPRLDNGLVDLARVADRVLRDTLEVALRFLAADSGRFWPQTSGRTAALLRRLGEPAGIDDPLPALATLLLLSGSPTLSASDLDEIGHALVGLGGSITSTLEAVGRIVTAPVSMLSSPNSRRLADQLAERLADTPAARRVLSGLSHFSGTPLAAAAERGLNTLTMVEDMDRLAHDGNPIGAWHRKGAGYIADVAGAGFDVSSNACAQAPTYATCGVAALTGAVWAGAQTWQHRERIARGVDLASQEVMAEARRVRQLAVDALDASGDAQRRLIATIRGTDRNPGLLRLPPVVTHAIADTVEHTGNVARRAVDETGHVAARGWHWLAH